MQDIITKNVQMYSGTKNDSHLDMQVYADYLRN